MARVEVIGVNSVIKEIRKSVDTLVDDTAKRLETTARAKTPIKTGNARKNWNNNKTRKGFDVENRVPYIERLEKGHSRQAPRGIVGPTLKSYKGD